MSKGCYPGLVNISGTYCFFNSTVQVRLHGTTRRSDPNLSFLGIRIIKSAPAPNRRDTQKCRRLGRPHPSPRRPPYSPHRSALPAPSLAGTRGTTNTRPPIYRQIDLNTPHRRPSSFKPSEVIKALSSSDSGKRSALFSSREHQDAQELFQLLTSVVRDEAANVLQERMRERGLGGLAVDSSKDSDSEIQNRSVFDGLMAQRRSCVECGYTEAVRHFAFDNISLTVPPNVSTLIIGIVLTPSNIHILPVCCDAIRMPRRLYTSRGPRGLSMQQLLNGRHA